MATDWSEEENEIFVNIIKNYRTVISGKDEETAEDLTWKVAEKLQRKYTLLENRTIHSVYKHLSYIDNLLAGVGTEQDYSQKEEQYFNMLPRVKNDNYNIDKTSLYV
jgi:ABC-type branched-subunit amino acid transport system ATPase component